VPGDDAGPGDEVLAALVTSLRGELAESRAALARAVEELAAARERIAELEAWLRQTPRNSYLRGNARRERITAGATAALAEPPAGSYAAMLAARILDGQSALHLSGRCRGCGAGTRSGTCPDTRSSGRA
jgi:hypothetical protein